MLVKDIETEDMRDFDPYGICYAEGLPGLDAAGERSDQAFEEACFERIRREALEKEQTRSRQEM